MRTGKYAAAAAIGLLLLGGGAFAQQHGKGMMQKGMRAMGPDCPMMGMRMGGGGTPANMDTRLNALKTTLKITDAQQAQWSAYADAVKKSFEGMQGVRQTMQASMAAKTPVERLDLHVTAMEGRVRQIKDLRAALGGLYGALSDEQKKIADAQLTGMGCMM